MQGLKFKKFKKKEKYVYEKIKAKENLMEKSKCCEKCNGRHRNTKFPMIGICPCHQSPHQEERYCTNCGKPESERFNMTGCTGPCNFITPPLCTCGKQMKPAYDEIAKKITGYLWSCECSPGLTLSIG